MGWLDDAAALPVAFAQVREDPLLDLEVVAETGPGARILMVASGGCTAAFLASSGTVASLHLVDPNPAQIALTKLKLHLVAHSHREERAFLLGHTLGDPDLRRSRLETHAQAAGISLADLGPEALVSKLGPDEAGRYERLFAHFRGELKWRGQSGVVREIFGLADLEQQRTIARDPAFAAALRDACDATFSLPILVRLFGTGATGNARAPFAEHFRDRIHAGLAASRAIDNPWLRTLLLGASDAAGEPLPWIGLPPGTRVPPVRATVAPMSVALREADPESADVVHLSNILDWLNPEEARDTLMLATRVLAPGGVIVVRQLNSTLDIPSLGGGIEWDAPWGAALLQKDRSFFYRAIHVGRRS